MALELVNFLFYIEEDNRVDKRSAVGSSVQVVIKIDNIIRNAIITNCLT